MTLWVDPAPSMRTRTDLPARPPGSWASAAVITAMWSVVVFDPAFPGRSAIANSSPVPAGPHAPDHDVDARQPLVVDVDATLVTSHSEKENARPTFKKGFGFHPLCAFLDHGPAGTGELLA